MNIYFEKETNMKIHEFSPEAQSVIDTVSIFIINDNNEKEIDKIITGKIYGFMSYLDNTHQIIDKDERYKRYELALISTYCLFSFYGDVNCQGNDIATMLERFKKIKSGEALNDPYFINLCLKWGFLELSQDEIKVLIENNTSKI